MHYVLLGEVEIFCKKFKSSRKGFPLQIAKADTVHSSQGITAGEGEDIERIIMHGWDLKWENRWPGCFYVGTSRVKQLCRLYFSTSLDKKALKGIGSSKMFKILHAEEIRIKEAALNKRKKDLRLNHGTKENFVKLLREFLNIADDKWKNKTDDISKRIIAVTKLWREALSSVLPIQPAQAARQCCGMMMCVCGK